MSDFSNPSEWRDRIEKKQQSIEVPQGFPQDAELIEAYRLARALDAELIGYFQKLDFKIERSYIQSGIREICDLFKSDVLQSLQKEKENFANISKNTDRQTNKFNNIFQYAGCEKLYLANQYTRFISVKLGHKFEDIANLSPYVFSPKNKLDMNIKGIDVIAWCNNQLYYTQIKSQKNTLTGSQVPRTIKELKIHPHSMFVAALDMGSSSSISRTKAEANGIQLQVGEGFWSEIGISYLDVISAISKSIQEIEVELYRQ